MNIPLNILQYYNETPFKFTYKDGEFFYCTAFVFNDSVIFGDTHLGEDIEMELYTDGLLQLILIDPADCLPDIKRIHKQFYKEIKDPTGNILYFADTPKSMNYAFLLSIDMFDLIEKGMAIDVTTLPDEVRNWAIDKHMNKFMKYNELNIEVGSI